MDTARGSRSTAQLAAEEQWAREDKDVEYVRPKAPAGTPVKLRRMFNQVVNSAPDHYIQEHDIPMVMSYCRQSIMLEDIQTELMNNPESAYCMSPKGVQETSPRAKRELQLCESIRRTAVALRLPPGSRFSLALSAQTATKTASKSHTPRNEDNEDIRDVSEIVDLSSGRG